MNITNHFHFLIKPRNEKEILDCLFPLKDLAGFQNLQGLDQQKLINTKINKQFSNFFNSYAKAFNKLFNRTGKLFRNSMKFKEINNEVYLKRLIHYIHMNPVIHGFVNNPDEWKYSSYQAFISNKKTMLERDEIILIYGNEKNFMEFHKQEVDVELLNELEF